VHLELDCFWAFKAGLDPLALLRRHAPRIGRLHLKDSTNAPEFKQMDVGAGVIDWAALLPLAESVGARYGYVEHDEPADPWATVTAGRSYLRSLGY
jgi:sugar phosphate isomerase/epimerase